MGKTKYVIVSKFEENCHFVNKVKNFRMRVSEGSSFQSVHLPLLAPFELLDPFSHRVFDEFEEEFQSFFIDLKSSYYIKFNRFGVYQNKKKYLLYVDPILPSEFEYCLESLSEIKKDYTKKVKSKESLRPYLVLGKFFEQKDLEEALQRAAKEFILPVEIKVKSFSLFFHKGHEWQEGREFLTFDEQDYDFEIENTGRQLVV